MAKFGNTANSKDVWSKPHRSRKRRFTNMRQFVSVVVLMGALLGGSTAWALDGTTDEIEVTNGAVGIINPLIVGKGGTGAATLTDGGVLVGSDTGAITALT